MSMDAIEKSIYFGARKELTFLEKCVKYVRIETYEDGTYEYVIEFPDYKGVMGVGDTMQEAVDSLRSAIDALEEYRRGINE